MNPLKEYQNSKFIRKFLIEYSKKMSENEDVIQAFTWKEVNKWIVKQEERKRKHNEHAKEYQRKRYVSVKKN
tara:strand:+ start:43 stop:258 length:216 start_codon:yes stop_codon:yes gene_type:complete